MKITKYGFTGVAAGTTCAAAGALIAYITLKALDWVVDRIRS